jgi:APA family basic amino acid/polyamine antiporter
MMVFLPLDTWLRLAGWTVIGLLIYFGYSVRHAKTPRWQIAMEAAE